MDPKTPRLIEVAFPLKQVSLDSVHEKNVRHGHISTLHIWPARRPLAACRAALIATLLPDPGDKAKRDDIYKKLAGRIVAKEEKGKVKESTEGGILHWGRESEPDLDWFREEIKKAYGGRAPRIMDPFSGGGAIPLEAMRLGCEVTAIDINPVAWFILKCTLEYPQKLAGQKRPLPDFILRDQKFMNLFYKVTGENKSGGKASGTKKGKPSTDTSTLNLLETVTPAPKPASAPLADLSWHVRAWGKWVLAQAKTDLESYYPVIDNKPAVAYLWARTVKCKHCRAALPLLKTRWLCKKKKKRILLTVTPNAEKTGVVFGVQEDVPVPPGTTAQKKESDKRLGLGTMSKAGATCPCCGLIMTSEDIRLEAQAGRLDEAMTTVIVDGLQGKEYRLPTPNEIEAVANARKALPAMYAEIPFGLPDEPVPKGASRKGGGSAFTVHLYGRQTWGEIFNARQLISTGSIIKWVRTINQELLKVGYDQSWSIAICGYLYAAISRLLDRNSELCTWQLNAEKIGHTFARYALPITWDYVEVMPWADSSGGFLQGIEWVAKVANHLCLAATSAAPVTVLHQSAITAKGADLDVIVTDPPYYDAIPYSDLMDFFYVFLKRTMLGCDATLDAEFQSALSPKWDHVKADGELIDDAGRHEGNNEKSKHTYEEGMGRAFQACHAALAPDGRLVIVFAHKQPDAWETLVAAIIRAGFVVDGSWPIQTERTARTRSLSSAALSSSVWLVCKKRPVTARPGWDTAVFGEMRQNISTKLHSFWDAGIRGPDFVWAATGPAMEAYSKYPVVKKTNNPGETLAVPEFLRHVRRLVVDFVVGRVLSRDGQADSNEMDDVTTYYLLHRSDFGLNDAPAGACILYAVSCNLGDRALSDQYDLILHSGGLQEDEEEAEEEDSGEESEADADSEPTEGTGSKVRLKAWHQRKRKTMGYDSEGRPAPLIDQVHRLMHLWKARDESKVDQYIEARALRKSAVFHKLLQALIELCPARDDERSLLESLSNHIGSGAQAQQQGFEQVRA